MEFFSCQKPETYRCYAYGRLSWKDQKMRQDSDESNSIKNQRDLIHEYISRHPDLELCMEGYDDNYSGTNFDRPHFQEMMRAIEEGKIDCIVVKDLSRFGRNAVETGNYLERVFPFLGVRFISISEGCDSTDANAGDTLAVALKNLVNEAYSMDISRKSGSVLREKQRRGEFIGAYASYGYLRDPKDVHKIIIDPETAPIVREMFRRAAEGEAVRSILRWLNTEGILSPGVYRYQKGICLDKRFAGDTPKPWSQMTVKNMLQNPVYLGKMVQGRRRSQLYAGKPDRRLPPSEWTVVENTHEPIIDQETFDRVQAVNRAVKEKYRANLGKYDYLGAEDNIFRGLIYCADCGRPMVCYKSVTCKGKKEAYRYICPHYANLLEKSGCSYKYLPVENLKSVLSQFIAQEADLAVNAAALVSVRQSKRAPAVDLELTRAKSELKNLEMLRERLMRDFLAGVLGKEDHDRMKQRYVQEGQALEEQITRLQKEQRREKKLLTSQNPWIAAFQKHTGTVKLTDKLVRALVERITVYANNRIEIELKYRDERAMLLDELQKMDKEASA